MIPQVQWAAALMMNPKPAGRVQNQKAKHLRWIILDEGEVRPPPIIIN